MAFSTIKDAWTPLHDALYYPLSNYLLLRRYGDAGTSRTNARRRALAIIAKIKGRA